MASKYDIDRKYGVPLEEISCPGCGQRYGHHKTKVDTVSQECSTCAKEQGYKTVELMDADRYIQEVLGYHQFTV